MFIAAGWSGGAACVKHLASEKASDRSALRLEREQLLWAPDAAQGVAADRDQALPRRAARCREGGREEDVLVGRAAHRGDPAGFVDGGADDGEVEPVLAADIAVEDLADMKAEID